MTGSVILLSGGLDSTVLAHMVAARKRQEKKTIAMTFVYGQRAQEIETRRAVQTARRLKLEHLVLPLELPCLGQSALTNSAIPMPRFGRVHEGGGGGGGVPSTYVPHRHSVMLALAASCAEANRCSRVYIGCDSPSTQPDCQPQYIDLMTRALSAGSRDPVTILAPLLSWSKAETILEGVRLGVDFAQTWTCYKGGSKPCRRCRACGKRARAFAEAGICDPLGGDSNGQKIR